MLHSYATATTFEKTECLETSIFLVYTELISSSKATLMHDKIQCNKFARSDIQSLCLMLEKFSLQIQIQKPMALFNFQKCSASPDILSCDVPKAQRSCWCRAVPTLHPPQTMSTFKFSLSRKKEIPAIPLIKSSCQFSIPTPRHAAPSSVVLK